MKMCHFTLSVFRTYTGLKSRSHLDTSKNFSITSFCLYVLTISSLVYESSEETKTYQPSNILSSLIASSLRQKVNDILPSGMSIMKKSFAMEFPKYHQIFFNTSSLFLIEFFLLHNEFWNFKRSFSVFSIAICLCFWSFERSVSLYVQTYFFCSS